MAIKYTANIWLKGKLFSRSMTVKGITDDGIVHDAGFAEKVFFLEDGSMHLVTYSNIESIKYSKERKLRITEKMSNEAGQGIPLKD